MVRCATELGTVSFRGVRQGDRLPARKGETLCFAWQSSKGLQKKKTLNPIRIMAVAVAAEQDGAAEDSGGEGRSESQWVKYARLRVPLR